MKVLARRVSSHPKDTHFRKKYKEIHLISNNFMGKQAFWMASFQFLSGTSQNVKTHKHLTSKVGPGFMDTCLYRTPAQHFQKAHTPTKKHKQLCSEVSHFSL